MKKLKRLLVLCAILGGFAYSYADIDEKSERVYRDSTGCPGCVRKEFDKGWCGSCFWYNICGCTASDVFEVYLGDDYGRCITSSTTTGGGGGSAGGTIHGVGVEAHGSGSSETHASGYCDY